MANLPVKWFDNRFHGMPKMNGTPGAFTEILDACLVNGFGHTNVVTVNVTNKIASIILQDGVEFFKKSVVAITGFTNPVLNTEYRVLKAGVGIVYVEINVADGPLSIVAGIVKYAPLGWFKPFSAVSKGIYKPSKVDALDWMFYMNDTAAQWAEVKLIEDASNIDAHSGSRPSNTVMRWGKSGFANTEFNSFSIIGDPYCFYYKTSSLITSQHQNRNYGSLLFVGEGGRLTNKLDPFAVYLTGKTYTDSTGYNHTGNIFQISNEDNTKTIISLRSPNGLRTNEKFYTKFRNLLNWEVFNFDTFYNSDNVVSLFKDNYINSTDRRVCTWPGMVNASGYLLKDNFDYFIDAENNTLNRDLILMTISQTDSNSSTFYYTYFDITGPWR